LKGTLGRSPADLLKAMELSSRISKELNRVYVYASMFADQDTRDSKYQAMKQEITQVGTDVSAATAWIEPEILKMDRATVETFIKSEPKLEIYRQGLEDVLRRQAHTGTEGEEKIIAEAGLVTGAPAEIFNLFSNADFPYPTVTLSDGKEVKLDQAAFQRLRPSPNRDDRKKVFASFFGALGGYRNTFGAQLNGAIQRDLFYKIGRA